MSEAAALTPDDTPLIAVVVPVYKHSVFLGDAVMSALAQHSVESRVVIVDDGCPHLETRRMAAALAAAHPGRVASVRRVNGGLSAARNTGIAQALARWPDLSAIYFLDADNMIEPQALARGWQALNAAPGIGWAYPDIAMFGSSSIHWDFSGPYSRLKHLETNICEAASLVSRAAIDSGCRFDESMRQGFEDWDFWWTCLEKGFTGRHVPQMGLRYRKRPESMLAEAERLRDAVLGGMRRKHAALLKPKAVLALEAHEAPRFALMTTPETVLVGNDPAGVLTAMATDDYAARIAALRADRFAPHAPPFLTVLSQGARATLNALKIDRSALLAMQRALSEDDAPDLVGLQLRRVKAEAQVAWRWVDHGAHEPIDAVMAGPRLLHDPAGGARTAWFASLHGDAPEPRVKLLRIDVPDGLLTEPAPARPDLLGALAGFFLRLDAAGRARAPRPPSGKERSMPWSDRRGSAAATVLECGAVLPLSGGAHDIALTLPLIATGGVERVALGIAETFQRAGWRCHLLVMSATARLDRRWLAAFDTVTLVDEAEIGDATAAGRYLGVTYPQGTADADMLTGLLASMDAVLNFHCATLHPVMARLRGMGVKTGASLHVHDQTAFGRETGHAARVAGYEHVYDVIAPVSRTLGDWLHGVGVPADKIVVTPNGPAYALLDAEIDRILAGRRTRDPQAPLNILFLGRLDRQKGLERLAATISAGEAAGQRLSWRVAGETVIGDAADWPSSVTVEPAARTPEALTALYAWADVLFLPSLWEGLPLTVLEAMRLGVAPVAADVGAVGEAVEDGRTGVLLRSGAAEDFTRDALAALGRLASDRALLTALSRNAAATATRRSGPDATALVARMELLVSAA